MVQRAAASLQEKKRKSLALCVLNIYNKLEHFVINVIKKPCEPMFSSSVSYVM